MKTLIVYYPQDRTPKFTIVDGDYSKFNGVCVNCWKSNGLEQEFSKWFFDCSGNCKFELTDDINTIKDKGWDKVALVSCL